MYRPFHLFCILAASAAAAAAPARAQQATYPPPAGARGCEFPRKVSPAGSASDGAFSFQLLETESEVLIQLINHTRLTGNYRIIGYDHTTVYIPGQVPARGAGVEQLVESGKVPYPGLLATAGAETVRLPVGPIHQFTVEIWTLASAPDMVDRVIASGDDPAVWAEALLELAAESYWAGLTEAAKNELLARLPRGQVELFVEALALAAGNVGEALRDRVSAPPHVTRFDLVVTRPYCVRIEGVEAGRVHETGAAITARAVAYDWMQEDVSEHLSWTWSYGGAPAGNGREVSLTAAAGSVPLSATAVHPVNAAYRGTASVNVSAAERGAAPEGPGPGEAFSGVYTADLPASFEVALGTLRRWSGAAPSLTMGDFEDRMFARGATLTFFPDGSGLAQGTAAGSLQIWSGVSGAATFAWKRLENGNIRVRFVATTRNQEGAGDVRRLQMEYEERGGLLYPIDMFVMKVTTSSYVQFNVEQARNPFFSVVRDCPGNLRGQSLHLYRDFPKNDDFAQMAYARRGETVPQQAAGVAQRVNRMSHIVPPEGIDEFFENPVHLCSGNPGVVH